MTVTTLDKLAPGESGRIVRICGRGPVRRRLVDMGFTRGAKIEVVKLSPLGDPVEYRLRGYHLSLRKSEASTIEVELIEESPPRRKVGHFPGKRLPLLRCESGQQVEVVQIRGGKRRQRRLKGLGLKPGSQLTVIRNDFPGPMILAEKDGSRMELGKGMASHILVKTVSGDRDKDIP